MNPLLDDVIGDLLAEGPTTIEAAHQRLIELDESLAARGQPWLLGALRRHPQVRLLSGKRFELREDTAFELEIAERSVARRRKQPQKRSLRPLLRPEAPLLWSTSKPTQIEPLLPTTRSLRSELAASKTEKS